MSDVLAFGRLWYTSPRQKQGDKLSFSKRESSTGTMRFTRTNGTPSRLKINEIVT